jgi:hypothetical protein
MKGRTALKSGGKAESPKSGDKEFEADEKTKPEARANAKKIDAEAEERKHGGRTKKKHVGNVHGHHKHHAGRKPRKSGGRTGSNMNPLSSAHGGTKPKGRTDVQID